MKSVAPQVAASVPPAVPVPPSAWHASVDRLTREIEARASRHPTRAALLLAAQAHVYVDAMSDPLAATNALARASELAPDARFVATTLRWLSERAGDPTAVLARTRAELATVGEERDRAALLWYAAAVEEHVASDVPSATRTIRELLALEPNDIAALDALGALFLRSRGGDGAHWDISSASDETVFRGVVDVLDRLASLTDDAITRSAMSGAAGALRDRYLADVDGALGSVRRALEADPTNAGAQATLEAMLLRGRAWNDYAQCIAAQAERTSDAVVARELYERAGAVYSECIGDHTRAAHCFLQASTLDETDPGPLEKLTAVLEAAGLWAEAAAAYERLLVRLHDPVQRAWALVRLGRLEESRLERPDAALTSYTRAVDAAPTFAPAVQALLRVSSARGMPLALALEQREADRIADPAVRAVRYAALAELAHAASPADLCDDAATLYERTLALDPTNAAAFDALDRMYRAASQWPRLVSLYENALTTTSHPRRARSLRLQLAELLHARSGQASRAADLRREALTGPEDRYDVLVSLARSLADAGRWTEHVDVLEAQASMLTGPDEIAAVYRIGAALETRVKDPKRALAAYEIVIDRAPRHEAAARAIARIHEKEGRWERVIDSERRLLDLASRPEDVIAGLIRIARVFEEQLGRVNDAVDVYMEALERAPDGAHVVAALERLLRGTRDHRRLAHVLQRYADASTDPRVRVRARLRAASIIELCLDDTAAASAAYVRAIADAGPAGGPGDVDRHAALWGLLRLQERRGEWPGVETTLSTLLESTSQPEARRHVLVRLARNAELRLDDLPRATRFYEQALEAGAEPRAVAVDRLRIARLERNRDGSASCLEVTARSTTDLLLRDGLLRVLAASTEHRGSEGAERALALYDDLVRGDPEDIRSLDGRIRCSSAASANARVAQSFVARGRATTDASFRALLGFAAGVLDETASREDAAEAAYSFALLSDGELLPALDGARRLRTAASDWSAVVSLAERTAKASLDRENVAEAWMAAADVYEARLNDTTRALACYRALLAGEPGHVSALERALVLLEAASDFAGAASILLEHAEAPTSAPAARARALVRRATILAARLGDTASAILDLRRAMALAPGEDEERTVQALADLEERVRNWQEALQLYERIAQMSSDAASRTGPSVTTRRRARLAQARIYGEELRDDARAKEILEELVSERPDDRDAMFRLAETSARAGHDARALHLFETLSASGAPAERVRALVAIADLKRARSGGSPSVASEAALARVFDLAITDPSMIVPLEERIVRDGDHRAFVTHGEAAVSRVRPNTPGVLPMRTVMARVLREKLGRPADADRQLAAIIHAFPDSMESRLTLATSLIGRDDEGAALELRRAVAADPTSPGPFEALVTLTRRTGRTNVAVLLASAAAFLEDCKGEPGNASPEVETTLTERAPARALPQAFLYDEAMSRLVGPTRARFLRSVLALLDPFLGKIFLTGEAMLETRPRMPDAHPVSVEVRADAAALGVSAPHVHRGVGREVALLLTEPRVLVLGGDLLGDAGRGLASFHGAYVCARLAANGGLYVVPRQQAVTLLDAVTLPDADGPAIRDLRKRASSALPRKTRKELERLVTEASADLHAEFSIWEAEEARRSLYSAIVLCRDVRAAFQVLAPEAIAMPRLEDRRSALSADVRLREVLEFIASPACWDAVQRIYGQP